jgi:uncharacterized protein (TIGR02145 family)
MKSTTGWLNGGNGTNRSGFSGLPGGIRGTGFTFIGNYGFWWFSSEDIDITSQAYYQSLNSSVFCLVDANSKFLGMSVRCVKD